MIAVVVHHRVQFHFNRKLSIKAFQEFEKLLMTMSCVTLSDHFTLCQFEGRKERRGAVALAVMEALGIRLDYWRAQTNGGAPPRVKVPSRLKPEAM